MRRIACTTAGVFIVVGAWLIPEQAAAQQSSRARTGPDEHRSSEMLQNRVYGRLASSGSLAGSDYSVTVNGSTAVLQGTVADEETKQRATRLAQRVRGIDNVTNNLEINRAAIDKNRNVQLTDDQLSKQIAEKLVQQHFRNAKVERDWAFGWEVEGDGWEFEIDVDDGDVTLSGDVPRFGVVGDVMRTTRSVAGVRTVTSELTVDRYFDPYGAWPYYGYYPYTIY